MGWVLEIDIRSYFDSIVQSALVEMVEKRVIDGSVLRLVGKWIRVGVIEDGRLLVSETGTGQGQPISLRQPPDIFLESQLPANYVRFRVTPDLLIAIGSHVKVAGEGLRGEQVELVVSRSSDFHEMQAYEELLGDALEGNSSRFARQDYVEEAWRILDPVLDDATPVYPYAPSSWGPDEADALAVPDGWIAPQV